MMESAIPTTQLPSGLILKEQLTSVGSLPYFCFLIIRSGCHMSHCDHCNSSACLSCSAGYLLYPNDGNCYPRSACPTGTYASSKNCASTTCQASSFLF